MSTDAPRYRFAPSPTGYFHVGGARTALYNWILAVRQGGMFVLRIEDTDESRNQPQWTQGIIDARALAFHLATSPDVDENICFAYAIAADNVLPWRTNTLIHSAVSEADLESRESRKASHSSIADKA